MCKMVLKYLKYTKNMRSKVVCKKCKNMLSKVACKICKNMFSFFTQNDGKWKSSYETRRRSYSKKRWRIIKVNVLNNKKIATKLWGNYEKNFTEKWNLEIIFEKFFGKFRRVFGKYGKIFGKFQKNS